MIDDKILFLAVSILNLKQLPTTGLSRSDEKKGKVVVRKIREWAADLAKESGMNSTSIKVGSNFGIPQCKTPS